MKERHIMKKTLAVLSIALLAGCDYSVPLSPAPSMPIDRRILGAWERPKSTNEMERLVILELGPDEYFVSYPSGTPGSMFAQAWLTRCESRTLVQLEWFGTAEGNMPDGSEVYQIASYSLTNNELTVRMLNPSVVGKGAKTPDELAKAIEAKHNDAALFQEPMVFKKVAKTE